MVDTELITFKNVKKRFGKEIVMESINLDIPENEITCIVGKSGSGKSTLLKLLIGFYKPDKGEIRYLRKNILKQMKTIKKDFGFASQECSFYNKLTVKENIYYFGKMYHIKRKEIKSRMDHTLKIVGLEKAKNTLAENLSIGMRKRLEIACSNIHHPKVLVLDEPTASLDPILRNEIFKIIKRINKKNTTIIMTSQVLNTAEKFSDNLAILSKEKIEIQGSPSKIKDKYNKETLEEVFEELLSEEKKDKPSKNKKEKDKNV